MGLPVSFIDYSMSFAMLRIEAEIYMRTYQYAAQDFRSTSDCNIGHQAIAFWQEETEASVLNYAQQVSMHIHEAPEGPTSMPLTPMIYMAAVPSIPPINKTGTYDNIAANVMVPTPTLTYIDLSFRAFNIAVPNFRRGLMIPWAYGPIALSLKLE